MRNTLIILGGLLIFSIKLQSQICSKSQLPSNLQNGLVAFYPFCGNANDESGNNLNGVVNGQLLTPDRFGINSSAYEFSRNTALPIEVTTNSTLDNLQNITISLWVKLKSYSPHSHLVNKSSGGSQHQFVLSMNSTGLYFYYNDDPSAFFQTNTIPVLNEWHHIVLTYQYDPLTPSLSKCYFYLNGNMIHAYTTNAYLPLRNYNLRIGGWYNFPATNNTDGFIDDVLIFNRAISCSEVKQVYDATLSALPQFAPLSINPFSDTTKICGLNTILDAGSGYATYNWSDGSTSQTITPSVSGFYKVTVTTAPSCSASDSTYLSMVNANIINNDTTICKGASVKLSIDSLKPGQTACTSNMLPANLKNGLVAYYPFCGNTNDASGNGNNGTATNIAFGSDRFGKANSSGQFSKPSQSYYYVPANSRFQPISYTLSTWFNTSVIQSGGLASEKDQFIAGYSPTNWLRGTSYSHGLAVTDNSILYSNQWTLSTSWQGYATPSGTIKINQWYHAVTTYDASTQTHKFYLDGVLLKTTQNLKIEYLDQSGFYIGASRQNLAGTVNTFFDGKIDDVGFWNRPLSDSEVKQLYYNQSVVWSTGDTSNSINVSPTQTTKYYVTVSDGITSCKDSVTVTVNDLSNFNPLQDTVRVCGDSIILDAGSGYTSYAWNTGATTQKITAKNGGQYSVNVINASGCTASDSSFVSIVKAKILQRDTSICRNASVKLSLDSTISHLGQDLVAWFPFNGSANDLSGNSNNGVVTKATLTSDRFGRANTAYYFNGTSDYINVPNKFFDNGWVNYTISFWMNPERTASSAGQSCINTDPHNGIQIGFSYNNSARIYHWKNSNPGVISWDILANDNFNFNPVPLNNWYHIVVVKQGFKYYYYVNGNLDKTVQTTKTPISYFTGIIIGASFVSAFELFKGKLDDYGLWKRALSSDEIKALYNTDGTSSLAKQSVSWSNNSSANSITVTPTQTTKYYVTVSDGITSCKDSVTVTVNDLSNFNPLQDTVRVCGDIIILDAGSGYTSYAWNTGATTQKITAKNGGQYSVNVINASGCTASDSSFVSIVKAKILQRDTSICRNASVKLSLDSTISHLGQDLVAWLPFNGSANDLSGNSNNGVVTKATLTSDRFGRPSNAYYFNGTSDYINVPKKFFDNGWENYTISFWMNPERTVTAGGQTALETDPHNGIGIGYSYNSSGKIYHFKNSNPSISSWDILKNDNFNLSLISLNNWYHVAIVKQGLNYFYYVNGLLDKSVITTKLPISYNTGIVIGASFVSASELFKGKLDDYGLWKRALTSAEIKSLYNSDQTLKLSKQNISWSTGGTSNSITVSPNQTTKYYVSVTDGITTCKDSVTVTVNTLDTSIIALDATAICSSGGSVRLQAGVADSYEWLRNWVKVPNAVSRQYAAIQTGSYRVVVRNTAGCSDTSRAISVTLNPNPTVNYTINNSTQCLTGNGFVFTNTSSISSGTMTYSWVLGDGTTATTSNVTKTFATIGTYNIKLVATSDKQCKDSVTKQVTVNAQPTVPAVSGASEYCAGDSITLTTNASATRQWYRNNVLINGSTGTTLIVKQAGDYTVTTENGNGCKSTSSVKTITENALPTGLLNTPSSLYICEGTASTLTASGGSSYQWYRDGSIINQATSSSIQAEQEGRYSIKFISAKGCSIMSSNTINLALLKRPDAAFSYDSYCVDLPTNFSSRSTVNLSGAVTYSWNFGDENVAGNVMNVSHTYRRAGTFTARLIVTPTNCPELVDTAINVIAVQSPLPGLAYPPVNAIINRPQQLNARSIGINYLWSPGTFLNSISSRTPMTTPNREQLYRIAITNRAGCTTVDTQLVRAFNERNIYVPEAFSPDNDGRNDRLAPILVGINEMKVFRIYNRWGILVYDNKNANAYTGWDGTYKGVKQPLETYAWVAEGIDVDGQYIRRTGNTVLIR